jgi:preprotein translocase subunit SecG
MSFKEILKFVAKETAIMFVLFCIIDFVFTAVRVNFDFTQATYTMSQFYFNISIAFTYGVLMLLLEWHVKERSNF